MNMLNFKLNCRDCLRSNGMNNMLQVTESPDHYRKMTDFEVSELISNSLRNNGSDCEFCGSTNFDIINIKINEDKIFDLEKLKRENGHKGRFIFIYNIVKRNNEMNLNVDNGDNYPNTFAETQNFEKRCKNIVQDLVNRTSDSKFKNHRNGVLYMCFTGNHSEITIEKFRYIGFSKEDIIKITNNIAKNPFA